MDVGGAIFKPFDSESPPLAVSFVKVDLMHFT